MVPVGEIEFVESDGSLADRIQAGDRAAENDLARRYLGRVLAMMVARLRDRETARELADDVLMSTITALRRGTVKDTARLGAFIHGTALNLANNYQRSRGRRPRTEPLNDDLPCGDPANAGHREDDVHAVQQCVAQLSDLDQRILLLTLVESMKPGEIASRLGLAPETVRQRKSRAIQTVREMVRSPSRSPCREPQDSG